jgi:CRISPR/Cas system-associated exonuclease Cas4 (RecB family)
MNFTDRIADYIVEQQLDLKHVTIVLPSERAKKYIAASLFRKFQRPILAPEMITIDRWVRDLSDKTVIDKTRALVRLFSVQLENLTNDKDASFDEFLSWGMTLLSDFDELDRYLLSSEQVFKNLANIKEIENWSFDSENLSEGQKRFMEFWDRLPDYYRRLNEQLDKEKVCYMGKAYRFVAENIDVIFRKDKERHFIFAGFNALSKAEISIMKQLQQMGRGHILINADKYYLENDSHEAGRFMRQLMKELVVSKLPYVEDEISAGTKHLRVIECAQHTGQVKAASTILDQMTKEEIDETMVLLADESLIAPLLRNLPKKIGQANITLGLPLRNTSLRTWVDLLFGMQENKSRFSTEAIYIHDLQKLWNHPFLTALLSKEEKSKIAEVEFRLIKNNSIFQNLKSIEIGPVPDELLALLSVNWKDDWKLAMQQIRKINDTLYQHLAKTDAFEKAIIQGFDHALQDFENIIDEGIPAMSLKSFKHLFQQHWNTKSIAYHGNPLDGLQIMGLLETRLLDFKKIIVLGLNEGKMPPTNPIQTMIPMDLRSYFQLPTPRDKQGLFAHHFYRLLHACEDMWVTYTSAQESIGSNEASRYLIQLELELSRMNPNFKMERQFYSIPNETSETESGQEVQKTPEVIQRLDELFEAPISASALNKYMKCPLDFYYRHVLEFGEEDTIEEEVESSTLGTFIHNVLEKLYMPFARHNKDKTLKASPPPNITSFDIDKMLKEYESMIEKEFYAHFNKDKSAYATGKNLLSFKMAVELMERILKQEKKFFSQQTEPVFIEYLEAELHADLEIQLAGLPKTIHFKGFVDRIDSIGGKIRIIDYKSGKVKTDDVQMKDVKSEDELIKHFGKTKHALQLSLYNYLYLKNFGVLPYQAGIYSLINISDGIFPFEGKNKTNEELLELFERFIEQVINEIYNVDQPFVHEQTGMKNWCLYCD